MAEGMRVFTDATQSSPSGCKNSIARLLQKDVRRARYLDPRTSRWLSTDPALTDYLPLAPVDENAKKHNQNLPGMGGIYNTVNFHLYHYAGNNPVKYTDPDGRQTAYFNYNKFISNSIRGEMYAFAAGCQDSFGRLMNGLQSMFTTKPTVVPLGEASLSIGNFSITGTASYENGKMIFSGTPGAEVSTAQLGKLAGVSVTVESEGVGLNGDVSIPSQWVVDVKVNSGVQINKDGTVTITMKAGVGKNVKAANISVSGGAKLTLGWDTQNGNFGTAQNRKNNSLNQNIQIYNYSKSIEALKNCWEE